MSQSHVEKQNTMSSFEAGLHLNTLVPAIFKPPLLSVHTTNVFTAKCYRSRSLLWTEVLVYEITPVVDKTAKTKVVTQVGSPHTLFTTTCSSRKGAQSSRK